MKKLQDLDKLMIVFGAEVVENIAELFEGEAGVIFALFGGKTCPEE